MFYQEPDEDLNEGFGAIIWAGIAVIVAAVITVIVCWPVG